MSFLGTTRQLSSAFTGAICQPASWMDAQRWVSASLFHCVGDLTLIMQQDGRLTWKLFRWKWFESEFCGPVMARMTFQKHRAIMSTQKNLTEMSSTSGDGTTKLWRRRTKKASQSSIAHRISLSSVLVNNWILFYFNSLRIKLVESSLARKKMNKKQNMRKFNFFLSANTSHYFYLRVAGCHRNSWNEINQTGLWT